MAAGVGSGMRSGSTRSGTVVDVGVVARVVVGGAIGVVRRAATVVGVPVTGAVAAGEPTVVGTRNAVVVVPVGTLVEVVVVEVVVVDVVVVPDGIAGVVVGGVVVEVVVVGAVVVGDEVSTTMACDPAMLLTPDGTVIELITLPAMSVGALVSA